MPHCLEGAGSGTNVTHCLTAWWQWAVELLQRTASLPGGSGQWNSCNALPHCLGAVGSAIPAVHYLAAWGQWQWNPCNAPPYYLGAMGNATSAVHRRTPRGQRAVELLSSTAKFPRGSGQWNSCNELPH